MRHAVERVVVLGANGAMGAGSGAVFAGAGLPTVFLARTREKAAEGLARAEKMLKSSAIRRLVEVGDYETDLARAVAGADLVFEAVSEDLDTKRVLFEQVDRHRKADAIVATVSSGLSIAAMARGRSDGFRRAFLGMHFYNPPNVIVGCELVPHAGTDPEVVAYARDFLARRCGREVVETADTPAFAGNRVGFKVLNEVAQLAEEHGVERLDALLGPHTGRAMAPLATIDFVGWDVHRAIVDNLWAATADEAHAAFQLPGYMARLIAGGHLGAKTPARGGFFRTEGKTRLSLDVRSGAYRPVGERPLELPAFVGGMKALHRVGRYRDAFDALAVAEGADAELVRRVLLGYVSYGLGRAGEVVREVRDVDRIMAFGFNWAPPGLIADLVGPRRTVTLLERARLPVPPALIDAIERRRPLFDEPTVDRGRFFHGGSL
jgi:3-hydroxyacyl-CoA dehydrogenase